MNAPRPEARPLGDIVRANAEAKDFHLWSDDAEVSLRALVDAPWLKALRDELTGASVVVKVGDQLRAAMAVIALDGFARRMVLCPPDVAEEHMGSVVADAGAEALLGDGREAPLAAQWLGHRPAEMAPASTEWLLFTSGTSGKPKMVVHRLAGLSGAIRPRPPGAPEVTWATFYDIRRYGGLQILLRALLGGSSLVLSSSHEAPGGFLLRLGRQSATHVTGTPSHWRRALMCPELEAMAPSYVRLSGEIADQAVLDALKAAFPEAAMGHAYASTEGGVGFEVTDGLEGFPAGYIGLGGEVEMRVVDGSLQMRSARCAEGYAGKDMPELRDAEGFVDSGDMLELRDGRYHFVGRRGGIINVGGLKIHPEEVESVINRHPAVSMSLVKGRRNPVTGAIVVAELVLADPAQGEGARGQVKAEVAEICRQALPPHKVPASIRFVETLAVTAGGKLERAIA
jgi:acyl-coenzyme A synthetase/AMP-(fatty) acid ligase